MSVAAASLGGQGNVYADELKPQELENAFPNLSFDRMVHLADPGDGTGRLWVVLQPGTVEVFPNDTAASSSEVFLDITARVSDVGLEEGLLGLAFDPGYAANGYFYVYYSAANPRRSLVSRFSMSSDDPDRADPESELVILEVMQPFSTHNGGTLAFGADGYLYIGLGDGGSGGDPLGHGQNTASFLGSFLRIDVSGASSQERYRIPSDNPFVGAGGGVREEIWAYGFRNPWKFSFDPVTDELWAGDVGQDSYEEIDIIKGGRNYGWNVMEGLHCFPPGESCDQTGLEPPVFEYSTPSESCAIIGGHVYRGPRLPDLVGAYIYTDYCSGRIWGLRYNGSTVTDHAVLATTDPFTTALSVDSDGRLFILSSDTHIYGFVAPSMTPTPTPTPTPVPGPAAWGLVLMAGIIGGLIGSRRRGRRRVEAEVRW
jgi:glucose/arabinose dehydrogenase